MTFVAKHSAFGAAGHSDAGHVDLWRIGATMALAVMSVIGLATHPLLTIWLALIALCCLFVAGAEKASRR